MRNFLMFGLFVCLLLAVQFSSAQTVDEVIEKYVEAMGGKEKLSSLKSVKMEGAMSVQGNDVTMVTTKLLGVGVRLDISIMGTENYQIFTPEKGWIFMPVQGQEEPTEAPEDMVKYSQAQLDVQGPLFNYAQKGHKAALLGKETVDGAECYKIALTYKSGNTSNYFIDVKTNRINKTTSTRVIQGEEKEIANMFSNYKQNESGYWFPFTSTNMQGEINYSKIETNVAVDEKIFMPK